jgi:hypothetical protein
MDFGQTNINFGKKNWDCIRAIATNARVWQKRVFEVKKISTRGQVRSGLVRLG